MKFLSCISIVFIVSQLLHCVYSASSACTSRNERVKKALIYRNGHVFVGYYHVLLMVVTQCGYKERYHLLDLVHNRNDHTITINHRIDDYNYCGALQMRQDYQCVRPCSRVYYMNYGTMDDIYRVINNYEGQNYRIFFNPFTEEVTGRNCYTFVKDILSEVGQTFQMECGVGKRMEKGRATSWRVPGRPRQTCEKDESDDNC